MTKIHPKNWAKKFLPEDAAYVITHAHWPLSGQSSILIEPAELEQSFQAARYGGLAQTKWSNSFTRIGKAKVTSGASFADTLAFLTAAVPAEYRHLEHVVTVHTSARASWVPEAQEEQKDVHRSNPGL